jgi:ATP-binding cassette subfamily B protein
MIKAWQRSIAHVPQIIYLTDASLAENIAFGVPRDLIDMELVCKAAKQAQIFSFINGLPDKFNTRVGERGTRLSGGQRQRIGIARALYKQANVILLDEATSALDEVTESSVMLNIEELGTDVTILVIAHRLTTVQKCDQIFELFNGEIRLADKAYIVNNI